MPAIIGTLEVLDMLCGSFVQQPQQTDSWCSTAIGLWKALVLCSTSEDDAMLG